MSAQGNFRPGSKRNSSERASYLPTIRSSWFLAERLGPIPADARLYMYNGDAILLNPKTQAILDNVHGVLQLKGRC